MKKIVAIIQPFDAMQNLYAYENGNKIGSERCQINNIPQGILDATKKYDAEEIDLHGPIQFNRGLKKQIELKEKLLYNNNELKINLV